MAPSDRITLAFIGLGKQSAGLARGFLEQNDTEIMAGCDVCIPKLRWFQGHATKSYKEVRSLDLANPIALYNEHEQLLNHPDIDAVVIATPDHWHAKIALDAMDAGKDVYCEKPLTLTVEEGRKLVDKSKTKGIVFQTGSMQRSWRDFRHACELVINGYIGDVREVLVNVGDPAIAYNLAEEPIPRDLNWDRWCGPSPVIAYNHRLAPVRNDVDFWPDWRLYEGYGGGILTDWGAHMFDIAQWGLGMDHSGPVLWIPPEDPDARRGLKMIYENGVEMYHRDFDRGWGVRFTGTEGTLDVSRDYLDSVPANIATAEIKETDNRLYHSRHHYRDWLDAIKTRTQPICPAEVGHRSASVGNLANIAYKLKRQLVWDPVEEKFENDGEANQLLGRKYRRDYRL